MIGIEALEDLMGTDRQDVLSISLDVDPTKPEHQGPKPAYRIWLHQAVHQTLAGIVGPVREGALRTAHEVLAHVDASPVRGRGLAIFAAPGLWREYAMPFPLANQVCFGPPDLIPLIWAMSENEAYAILAVHLDHAQIAVAYLGRTTVIDDEALELDIRDWSFKSGRVGTYSRRVGIGAGRGAQADTFAARIDEHRRRFWRGVAQAAARALHDLHITRVIIGGPEEAVAAVRGLLPDAVRTGVIATVPLPSHATLAEVQERTLPVALADRSRREAEFVANLLDRVEANEGAVLGRTATLASLMAGEADTVVAGRDLDGEMWRCLQCGYLSAKPIGTCPGCGGRAERAPLRQMLPLLARRHGAEFTVVGPANAAKLADRVGALLRSRFRHKAV